MADVIYNIQFTDVVFVNSVDGSLIDLSGTIQVDYTTHTMTGILVAVDGANTYTFTNFGPGLASVGALPGGGATVLTTTAIVSGPTATPSAGLFFSYSGVAPASLGAGVMTTDASHVFSAALSQPLISTLVCFASGTLIRTPRGDVPVESLEAGDTILTASGERRPVKWMGHRRLRRDFGRTRQYAVVRIAAHAFAPERPAQDLVVSPGHAICVDLMGEVLILAKDLVNGATIRREMVDEVTWWHVELDSHDILLANNLPAESYLAMANRGFFEEAGATQDWIDEGKALTHADFCRPVTQDRAMLAFLRERTLTRARQLGWTPAVADDLRLVVDGEALRPVAEQGAAMFVFPAASQDVRLASDVIDPADLGLADARKLGVMLTALVFVGADGEARTVGLDDPRLSDGVHQLEGKYRWTNGDLSLDRQFWAGMKGAVTLVVSRRSGGIRAWVAPAASESVGARPRLALVG